MKWLILLILSLLNIFGGNASPFFDDVETAAGSDEYLQSTPYSREQILAVREKLNITLENPDEGDEFLSVPELITKYGYPVEEHFVTTQDGYILRMHRIPPTKKGVVPCNKTVFLMHGILMSSADWIILGPYKAFAYYLADLGYDVWMGNARGNSQSKNHTSLNTKSSKFWKFSFHEIGTKDLPAMIDYVLKETNQKALYHVGHSQGTTTFFVMCSELPQYNKKIIAHYSLAPITFMSHAYNPIFKFMAKFVKMGEILSSLFGINELLAHSSLLTWVGDTLCAAGDVTEVVCKNVLFLIAGFDNPDFNATVLPILMGHTPAGCSSRQLWHYGQLMNTNHFRKYDYSPFNAIHYGPLYPIWPPSYNLKKVTAPVYLYYSTNDWLSHPTDVKELCQSIKNCRAQTLVSDTLFNHLDYLLGIDAKVKVYEVVNNDIHLHAQREEELNLYSPIEYEDEELE